MTIGLAFSAAVAGDHSWAQGREIIVIEGAAITFVDITERPRAEAVRP